MNADQNCPMQGPRQSQAHRVVEPLSSCPLPPPTAPGWLQGLETPRPGHSKVGRSWDPPTAGHNASTSYHRTPRVQERLPFETPGLQAYRREAGHTGCLWG